MAYKTKFNGTADSAIQLGDKNNPVKASIEGYYLGTKNTPDTGYGPGKLHIFQTQEGNVGVWGKTNSNRLLTQDHVGQMVTLTFTGMGPKTKGKNPAYQYELQYDDENTIDTSSIDVNAAPAIEDEEDQDLDSDETPVDVAPPVRATPPVKAASTPDAARQAKVQALLNSSRNRNA